MNVLQTKQNVEINYQKLKRANQGNKTLSFNQLPTKDPLAEINKELFK